MDLNLVQIIGNVTQDIELKQISTGLKVCNFSLATNKSWIDQQNMKKDFVEYHNIIFWGKYAEILSQYSGKGKKIYVEGRLQTRSWEAPDGSKRYKTEIIGEKLILLGGKNDGIPDSDFSNNVKISNDYTKNLYENNKGNKNKIDEIKIEDIPF